MKQILLIWLGLICFVRSIFSADVFASESEQALGHYPLCEASAAVISTFPKEQGECLFVGDNEQRNELFYFQLKDGDIDFNKQNTLNLHQNKDNEISDIEAITPLSIDTFLIAGSHSRNSKCEGKKKRRRYALVTPSIDKANVLSLIHSPKIKCGRLFGDSSLDDDILKKICDTIDAAEKQANVIEDAFKDKRITEAQAKERCNEAAPFNVEGVAAIPYEGKIEIWLGLRAPLLPEHPRQQERKKLAMLFRLKDLDAFTFDAVAFLDLGGRGIRELSYSGGMIWLIAGPAEDKQEPFQLRRFPVSELHTAEIIVPEFVQTLPASSEGLAIKGNLAYVVIDGEKPEDKNVKNCIAPSKYLRVLLR